MVLVAIGVVAEIFGVSCQTIRNWEEEGMFEVYRTKGGHRRFSIRLKDVSAREEIGAICPTNYHY